jgi:MYXO-CTERM domain-containing protein
VKGLEEVVRLKKVHARWVLLQTLFGALPIFAIVNKFRPMLSDGYGGDLLPTLLPESWQPHYNLILGLALAVLAASELLRRRFHKLHKEDLSL